MDDNTTIVLSILILSITVFKILKLYADLKREED